MRSATVSRCMIMARRAVQGIIADPLLPWSEPGTDCRLGVMDPAVRPAVCCPEEERAGRTPPSPRVHPVIDAGDPGEIRGGEIPAVRTLPVDEGDEDMLKDIGAVMGNPRDEILRYPRLVPAPFLATSPALPAVLVLVHTLFFLCDGHGFRHLSSPRPEPVFRQLSRTENIYNKMSNILYKYQCVTAQVLQYSRENTKNTSSKKTCKCPAGCTTAQDTKHHSTFYPPKWMAGQTSSPFFHWSARKPGAGREIFFP